MYVVQLEKKVEQLQLQMKEASRAQSRSTNAASAPSLGSSQSTAPIADSSLLTPSETDLPQDPVYVTTIPFLGLPQNPERTLPYGKSTGLEVLRRMRSLCGQYAGFSAHDDAPFIDRILNSLDVIHSVKAYSSQLGTVALPPADKSAYWIECAFHEAFCLWPFLDRSYVDRIATRFFCNDGKLEATTKNRDDLALLQMVIALGQRNDPHANDNMLPSAGLSKLQDTQGFGTFHFANL